MKKEINIDYTKFIDIQNITSTSLSLDDNYENQDKCINLFSNFGFLSVVLDGTGKKAGSKFACEICANAITREFNLHPARNGGYVIKECFNEANRNILLNKYKNYDDTFGASATGVYIQNRELYIGNAGNCRAYLIRENTIQQLTNDDTFLNDLISKTNTDEEIARRHPEAMSLTNIIGLTSTFSLNERKLWIWDLQSEEVNSDIIILCSDGVHKFISNDEILQCIDRNNLKNSTTNIVNKIRTANGNDDVSIIIIPIIGQLKNSKPFDYVENKELENEDDNDIVMNSQMKKNEKNDAIQSIFFLFTKIFVLSILASIVSVLLVAKQLI